MVGAGTREEPHGESSGQEGKGTEGICRRKERLGLFISGVTQTEEKTDWCGDKADIAEMGMVLADGITDSQPLGCLERMDLGLGA